MAVHRRPLDLNGVVYLEVVLDVHANLDNEARAREMWEWWSQTAVELLNRHKDRLWWITAYGDDLADDFVQVVAKAYSYRGCRYVPELRADENLTSEIGFALQGSASALSEISSAAVEHGYWLALCAAVRGGVEEATNVLLKKMIENPLSLFPSQISTILYTHDYARMARCITADLDVGWMV